MINYYIEIMKEMPTNPHLPEHGIGPAMFGQEYINDYTNWIRSINLYPTEMPYERDSEGRLVNEDGSEIVRSVARERQVIQSYLSGLPQTEQEEIAYFASTLEPMHPECRAAVHIATYNEERNIYDTLSEWSSQVNSQGEPLDPNLYEINVINNGPVGYSSDNTLGEVEKFRTDHPNVRVHVIDIEVPSEGGNLGMVRKLITDVILQRSVNRQQQIGPLYIESEDADILEVDKFALNRLIERFDSRPYLDAVKGTQDFSPTILMDNDYLFLERRSVQITKLLLRDHRLRPDRNEDFTYYNRVTTGGWNTAFTAEAYALIGGYLAAKVGEDVDISKRIAVMRGMRDEKGNFIPNTYTVESIPTTIQSSPRRFIHALARRTPAYADYANEQTNAEIRSVSPEELMEHLEGRRISSDNLELFEEVLTKSRDLMCRNVRNIRMQEALFNRLMFMLGFKTYKVAMNPDGSQEITTGTLSQRASEGWKLDYHIDDTGKVRVDNINNIKSTLKQYRTAHSGS
jgi:hypothetical protein